MTEDNFRIFVKSAERISNTQPSRWLENTMVEYEEMRVGPYYWSLEHDLAELDFNREVVHPGETRDFPDGAIRIMCDDDFFVVAVLPYELCANLDVRTIISILYPSTYEIIKNNTDAFKPDSDDPWWEEHFAKQDAYFSARIMKSKFDP